MLADPLREALCEHQEESAVIDTPLRAFGWTGHRTGRALRMRLRASLWWRW
jgi:hypothetical protein